MLAHVDGTPATKESVVALITATKKSVNHRRDSAATRGKSIHTAQEVYFTDGSVPQLTDFPVEDRGYVRAFANAVLDLQPEPLAQEVIVGSVQWQFAGRYDLLANIDGRRIRLDLKTGRRVYDQAHLQLAAYELAAVECEEEPSDAQAILRLGEDGEYEFVESHATTEMFLGVLQAYKALQALKAAKPRKPRKVAA